MECGDKVFVIHEQGRNKEKDSIANATDYLLWR
jgi:hypothetical protein